jgi:hypothetical protein
MNSTTHVDEMVHGRVLEFALHGKLSREDYEKFVPETEKMITEFGKIRILVTMHDFEGWDPGAMWADFKWNANHFHDIERLAIVGEKTWHRMMTGFARPFAPTQVRYYTPDELANARTWLDEE